MEELEKHPNKNFRNTNRKNEISNIGHREPSINNLLKLYFKQGLLPFNNGNNHREIWDLFIFRSFLPIIQVTIFLFQIIF
ncbi:hypothetical protein AAJ76_8200010760 [Vairimorpha ceranae]|uniref:Uncharacterized protein n=1 Tax=Vairimorpha ceranae TaxID=40302 RepID=A0A0F9YNR5_9MICR|nr:hypothetical protein AAJ76_8200010760 [Vairimorpha ceranae]KKO74332.1 hypothetical protein AAJ76_8200010760 [Vairimorpha ceranae]